MNFQMLIFELGRVQRRVVAADGIVVERALGSAVVVEVAVVDFELLLAREPFQLDAEREAENQPKSQNAKYDAKLRLSCNTLKCQN